ncbi:MAG TPA: glycerol-3-phosphate dehydrogenase/oxidase [Candidatus Methylacidiphilales bacterium]|jgi:glycerol-3-phosphate dehydrogenase|nr:glycerol-3-phosphate dehydrogenase/oxidase [Candidatus Methylacidiphilales bacterium]
MKRSEMLRQARERTEPWDLIVIGGGATGSGVAVDAATRGYATLLLEQHDFGKGTSSRSTKLVHGGVRYLEQGNIPLVMEALKERGILRRNAPHLVGELPFIVPSYSWWEGPFYGLGLKLYQMLSGRYGFGPSKLISREETVRHLPNVNREGLTGGVVYYDGQFDDTRLLINLIATAAEQGATALNYAKVTGLRKGGDGIVNGVTWEDGETGGSFAARAKVVVNATGPFSDSVRHLAEPEAARTISPSQGAHLVLDRSFLPGDTAIMVPHTSDGRVMFAIPWHGHTLVGTTDTPLSEAVLEPRPMEEEIGFMLETAGLYLAKKPSRGDILSAFAGIRPLVKSGGGENTAALSRDHSITIDRCGLVSIAGGKWTTYRNMAQDCVDQAATLAGLPEKACVTQELNIHGWHANAAEFGRLAVYGSDAPALERMIAEDAALGERLDAELAICGAEVVWAGREEMARTVEDALARRTRALFLNAKAAMRMAPRVAAILGRELGRDAAWEGEQVRKFNEVAEGYLVKSQNAFG